MRHDRLVDLLGQRLGVGAGHAELVLDATVQALDETAPGEMAEVHAALPGKLQKMNPAGVNARRSLDEFVMRIGDLTGTDDAGQAREYTHAAFATLAETISAGQLRELMENLPDEYGTLAPR